MNKKGASLPDMIKIGVGLVLGIILLLFSLWVGKVFIGMFTQEPSDLTENSMNNLESLINGLSSCEGDSLPFKSTEDYYIVSFDKSKVGNSGSNGYYEKPPNECYDSSCLIVCASESNVNSCKNSKIVKSFDEIENFKIYPPGSDELGILFYEDEDMINLYIARRDNTVIVKQMEDSETVESLNELYLAGCFEEIFEYSFEEYVEFTNTNFISNGEVLQRCECGDNCGDYSRWIKEYSEEEGLDPFLVLALIIQESNCRQTSVSSSDSFGIMQINEVTFNDICKDKIEGLSSFSDIKGNGNEEKNIRCGIKILKEKYNIFKEGIKESLPYETNNAFKNICDDCISSYPKYEEYSQFDAALRGYNGWGCGSDADVDYVEKVINIYNILSEYVLLPEYVGDYEEIQIEDETFYVSSSNVCGDETEVVDFKYLSEEYAPKIYIYEPFLEDRSYLFPVDDPKDILSGKTKFIVDVAREESNYDGNIINLSWEIFLPEHLTLREKPIEDQGINYAPYIPFVAKDNSAIVNSRHFKMHATFAKVYPLLGSGEIPYFKKSIDFDFGYFIIVPIKEGKGKLKAILKLKDHLGNCFVYEYLTKEYSSFSFFGSLKGTVTDNLNNPLETFIVELGCGGTKGTGYRKTITDSEGHYLFEEVLVGYGDVCIYEDEEFSTPVYHFRSISIEKDLTEEYNFKI